MNLDISISLNNINYKQYDNHEPDVTKTACISETNNVWKYTASQKRH